MDQFLTVCGRLARADLETKLGIKHPLHRKKLVLAMQARVDTNRPDPAGDLDCAWVLRSVVYPSPHSNGYCRAQIIIITLAGGWMTRACRSTRRAS